MFAVATTCKVFFGVLSPHQRRTCRWAFRIEISHQMDSDQHWARGFCDERIQKLKQEKKTRGEKKAKALDVKPVRETRGSFGLTCSIENIRRCNFFSTAVANVCDAIARSGGRIRLPLFFLFVCPGFGCEIGAYGAGCRHCT